jgi:transposase
MARLDPSDAQWTTVAPILPNKPRGVPRVDNPRVIDGIFWILCIGSPWRAISGLISTPRG